MKSFGCLALLLCFCFSARAELDTLWSHQVDITDNNWAIDVATVLQSGAVMAAASRSDGGSVNLWRFGLFGEIEWSGSVDFPSSYIYLVGIEQYVDGQIALLGIHNSSNGDSGNFLHVKRVSEAGVDLGDDVYPLQLYDSFVGLTSTADNSILLYSYQWTANSIATPLLVKFDSHGDTVWTRHTGPDEFSVMGRAVRELPNGDLLLGGNVNSVDSQYRGFVMRTHADGSTVWTNVYDSNTDIGLTINSLDFDAAGNIVVGGTDGDFWWFSRPWAIGLTPGGSQRWILVNQEHIDIGIVGIRATPDGGAVYCGSNFPDFGFIQSEIYSVEASGEPTLEMELPTPSQFLGMSNDGPRGAVIYGSVGLESGFNDGYLMRFGPTTTVQGFVRAAGSNAPLEGVRVELLESQEYAVSDVQGIYNLYVSLTTGTLRLTSPCTTPLQETVTLIEGGQNVRNYSLGIPRFDNPVTSINRVVTLDMWEHDTLTVYNDGNGALHFWTEPVQLSPTTYEWLRVSPQSGEIPPNSSAEIIVSVGAQSAFPEIELYGQARIHHNACPDTVNEIGIYTLALDSPERPAPAETFTLHPAYPNPFNAVTRVSFDVPQTALVTAKLYSIQGREVATLADRVFDAGTHELALSADYLATGVYLLRVTTGAHVATQKLVLLK